MKSQFPQKHQRYHVGVGRPKLHTGSVCTTPSSPEKNTGVYKINHNTLKLIRLFSYFLLLDDDEKYLNFKYSIGHENCLGAGSGILLIKSNRLIASFLFEQFNYGKGLYVKDLGTYIW